MKKSQYVELKENVRCEHWEVTDGKNVRSPFLLSCQTSSEEAACVWGGLWKRNTRRCLAITVARRAYAIPWIHKLRWVENERDENSLGVLARRERGREKWMFHMNVWLCLWVCVHTYSPFAVLWMRLRYMATPAPIKHRMIMAAMMPPSIGPAEADFGKGWSKKKTSKILKLPLWAFVLSKFKPLLRPDIWEWRISPTDWFLSSVYIYLRHNQANTENFTELAHHVQSYAHPRCLFS